MKSYEEIRGDMEMKSYGDVRSVIKSYEQLYRVIKSYKNLS
jgi:hypothetical protein